MENNLLIMRVKNEQNEDVIVHLDPRLALMSQPLEETEKDEVIPLLINKKILEKIVRFYELYNYSLDELSKLNIEIATDSLLKNLGEKNYQYFSEYMEGENKINVDKMKPLVDACYQYNFRFLWDLCQVVLGTEFFCESSEKGLEDFKKKFNLPEYNEEEIYTIIDENKEAFNCLNDMFMKYLENIKENDVDMNEMNDN